MSPKRLCASHEYFACRRLLCSLCKGDRVYIQRLHTVTLGQGIYLALARSWFAPDYNRGALFAVLLHPTITNVHEVYN